MKTPLRLPYLLLVALFLTFSACSDAIVDVDTDDPEDDRQEEIDDEQPVDDPEAVPTFKLGIGSSGITDPVGSENDFTLVNGLITVDGKVFSTGFGSTGKMTLRYFFGYVDRGSANPVNTGLFVYSDEPFEGAVEAGYFEGQTATFSAGGHEVVVASRDPSGTPLLGDGSRMPVWALHVPDFAWDGYTTVMGSSPRLDFIINRDNIEWEFDIERGTIWVNGATVRDRGFSLKQVPFDFLLLYFGEGAGNHGLYIVSNRAFEEAEPLGMFEGQRLQFDAGGNRIILGTEAEALLGDGAPIPAWVRHEPDYEWTGADGTPRTGQITGVSSDLQTILDRNASKRGLVLAR